MSDVIDIILPADQLEGTSATLSKWLVAIGAMVKDGDPIIELETDKVSMEICAPADGVLSEMVANEGEQVEVDTVLGRMSAGNDVQAGAQAGAESSVQASSAAPVADPSQLESTGADATGKDQSARDLIGPAVRRLLAQHDLDINIIPGSGRRGRVTRDDVRRHIASPAEYSRAGVVTASAPQVSPSPYQAVERTARPLQGEMVPHTNMQSHCQSYGRKLVTYFAPCN